MGLDAKVKCACWENGLCNPPTSFASKLTYDAETGELVQITNGLTIEEVLKFDHDFFVWCKIEEVLKFDHDFFVWCKKDACAHNDMNLAAEWISNWAGVRAFQGALRTLGEAPYAALLQQIPDVNGGLTRPADARRCLTELDQFSREPPFGCKVVLCAAETGETLFDRVEPYDGWLATAGATSVSYRLTADGMFQIEHGSKGVMRYDPDAIILFKAHEFTAVRASDRTCCFTDASSGASFVGSNLMTLASDSPKAFRVKKTADVPNNYDCAGRLRRVFAAAVESGHPVIWT